MEGHELTVPVVVNLVNDAEADLLDAEVHASTIADPMWRKRNAQYWWRRSRGRSTKP